MLSEERYRYIYEAIQSGRAQVMLWLSQFGEASQLFREVLGYSFDDPNDYQRMHLGLGICLTEMGDSEEGKREMEKALTYGAKNQYEENALWRLARLEFEKGSFTQAIQRLTRILQDFPGPKATVRRRLVLELLSRSFGCLGDKKNERRYAKLAQQA